MTITVPLDQLEAWLATELAAGTAKQTAILAGHFALFTAGGAALDHLDEAEAAHAAHATRAANPANPANVEMIAFTMLTWRAACGALARHGVTTGARAAQLLVLVDDIQFVRPALDDRGAAEKLSAALVANYRGATPALPDFHQYELVRAGLTHDAVLRARDDRALFFERELREGAVRRLRQHVGAGGAALSANEDGSMITVHAEGYDDYCLVHSGRTNCAGGYVELLAELRSRGVDRLIALVPMRCLGPITLGTSLARDTLGVRGLSVVNVAIPEIATALPAAVSRHSA